MRSLIGMIIPALRAGRQRHPIQAIPLTVDEASTVLAAYMMAQVARLPGDGSAVGWAQARLTLHASRGLVLSKHHSLVPVAAGGLDHYDRLLTVVREHDPSWAGLDDLDLIVKKIRALNRRAAAHGWLARRTADHALAWIKQPELPRRMIIDP